MASDAQTFGLAFLVVWGGLAAYFAYLHVAQARLARELDALRRRVGTAKSDATERKLK